MTFKTMLARAINSCDSFNVEGFEIDDVQMEKPIVITLPDGEYTVLYFHPDTEVEVDGEGVAFNVPETDKKGEAFEDPPLHDFEFSMLKPLTEEDLK